ncbi:hypothetical protein FRC18_012367 [Serendipita sp. 400]|nr:hypothetical protein FRC18_012367 [Serendipita sp. 400]
MASVPEVPRRLRALVDSCFEESLYDAGLNVLDNLRTKDAKPAPLPTYSPIALPCIAPAGYTHKKPIQKADSEVEDFITKYLSGRTETRQS